MPWYETLLWIALALFLEKLLDYAVWPRWVKRRWKKRGLRLTIVNRKPRTKPPVQ